MRPRRRHHPTSPPATPLDDDDLLAEFLLRLPPQPRSLPRAASVCKSWRRVVTDPHFLRRFRARHGTPPLLGFFDPYGKFFPTLTLEPPDRVPSARLSGDWNILACSDGLVLYRRGSELQVLDLMTGERSAVSTTEVKLPVILKLELAMDPTGVDRLRFHLIALSTNPAHTRLSVSVYSSDSGVWTHSLDELDLECTTIGFMRSPVALVGHAVFYHWFYGKIGALLRYDLETHEFNAIGVPWNKEGGYEYDCRYLFKTKDDLLCAVMLDKFEHTIQFWVWDTVVSADATWVLCKTVLLDMPLQLELRSYWPALRIVWVEEEKNVIFLWTHAGIVMLNLESMRCTKVSEETCCNKVFPYSSFMTAGRDVGLLPADEDHGN